MKDQILEAFKTAKVDLPEGLNLEGLDEKAERIYRKTQIEAPATMNRDLAMKHGQKAADVALLKIAGKLGIKDADLVTARIRERTHLLAELRGHDSLVRMILKIAASAGMRFDPEKTPTSTLDALKVGIVLQQMFASLSEKANGFSNREKELLGIIDARASECAKLEAKIRELQSKSSNIEEIADLRAEVIPRTEKLYFNICGEDDDGNVTWLTWKTPKSPPSPPTFKPGNFPNLSAMRMEASTAKAAKFMSLEDAREFMDWLQSRTLIKKVANPETLKIARFVAEDFGQ